MFLPGRDAAAGFSAQRPSPSDVERGTPTAWAACSAPRPFARARNHRVTASRLLAASISGVCAAGRRDAARPFRITRPGRPKTCMRGLLELLIRNSQLQRPLALTQASPHICRNADKPHVRRMKRFDSVAMNR
jgi:hypothetical protein